MYDRRFFIFQPTKTYKTKCCLLIRGFHIAQRSIAWNGDLFSQAVCRIVSNLNRLGRSKSVSDRIEVSLSPYNFSKFYHLPHV